MAFWSRRVRRPESFVAPAIRFFGPQDGPPERELKAALAEEFMADPSVERAYLARVCYADPDAFEVALCIRAPEDQELVRRVGAVFARTFGRHEHLDTVFLTEALERELRTVCQPFYTSG